jgi:hypothetical protein
MLLFLVLIISSLGKITSNQHPIYPFLIETSENVTNASFYAPSATKTTTSAANSSNKGKMDTYFLLVTSFIEGESGSGKLWVVPVDEKMTEYSYKLIVGLDRPTGVCFDATHMFLYIVDNGSNDTGYIYQFEVVWDSDQEFQLSSNSYTIVYEGEKPYDCKIDEYGNLYFVEAAYDSINVITYMDLYSGFTNMNYTIYSSEPYVTYPVSLDVVNSQDIYYANNYNGLVVGSVDRADAKTQYLNSGKVDVLVYSNYRTWGVTHTRSGLVFYSLDNGDIGAVEVSNTQNDYVKSQGNFTEPRGMCYGSGFVYVAEHSDGNIWRFTDNPDLENPQMIIGIEGSYSAFCVSYAQALVLIILGYII